MAYRKKLTLSFFILLSMQTILAIGLTYMSISELLRSQKRTILEEGWVQQETKLQDLFEKIFKDLNLYKFLLENEFESGRGPAGVEMLTEKCLYNTNAHSAVVYDSDGDVFVERSSGAAGMPVEIPGPLYSLSDFRFPNTRVVWSDVNDENRFFGLVSGTRIKTEDDYYYFILYTDLKKHLQQISERQTEVLTVISMEDRVLYSDYPDMPPVSSSDEWKELKIGNDSFFVFQGPMWGDREELISLAVLHSITAEKIIMNRLFSLTILVFLLAWVVAFLIAMKTSKMFTAPLVSLNQSLRTYLEKGYFPVIKNIKEKDTAFLITTFENMTKKIIQEEKHIRAQMEEIQMLGEFNENLIESMQSGIAVTDNMGVIEYCNTFFAYISGISSRKLVGENIQKVLYENFGLETGGIYDLIKTQLYHGLKPSDENSNQNYSMRVLPFNTHEHVEKVILRLEDTTEADRIWEESLIMDRVSSLSILSAGLAHEINNPLAAIKSHVDYLKVVEQDPEKKDSIQWISDGVARISGIVENASQFTRSSENRECSDIVSSVRETVRMLSNSKKKKDVTIELESSDYVPPLPVSEDLFKQLILNLLINAIDASGSRGKIWVNIDYDKEKGQVKILVEDQGKGIPENILPSIFNPFFSYGKGTGGSGLGLSVCYGIVTKAGGTITASSRENQGTIIEVVFNVDESSDPG